MSTRAGPTCGRGEVAASFCRRRPVNGLFVVRSKLQPMSAVLVLGSRQSGWYSHRAVACRPAPMLLADATRLADGESVCHTGAFGLLITTCFQEEASQTLQLSSLARET